MGSLDIFRESLRKIDFSEIKANETDGKGGFAIKAGLNIVDKAIQESLGSITEQYFFEYSLITSTINPKTKKLLSFAGVRAKNPQFKENVAECVNGIINKIYPTLGSEVSREERIKKLSQNWFHNPEMFLFPSINSIGAHYIEGSLVLNTSKWEGLSIPLQLEPVGSFQDIYAANMSYERSLDEMLEASKIIADSKKDMPKRQQTLSLIEEYHQGAKKLKDWYDKYLPIAGEKYDYITFPIVSTFNSDITNYYKKYFSDEREHVAGIGHFFLYFKNMGNKINDGTLDDLFIKVNQILSHIALNYVYGTGIALAENARKDAIRSAKAAIMSRNLSHNLGSHVMSYLKQSLKSVTDMEKSGALEEFSAKGMELPSKGTGDDKQKPELPYLVGTGRFISYLQERQDYIATVSTDYIPFPSSVNFKDCIYDELNPDYRYQRHDEWKGHKPANILLENIARSEGLSRQGHTSQNGNNIIVRYRTFDGLNTKSAKDDYDRLRQWDFSLPGGIMGRQAIFSIVENVIRNAAKHGTRNAGEDLVVTFDIIDPFESDGLAGFDENFKRRYSRKDIDELYIVSLSTNTKTEIGDLNKIQHAIYESLVDDDGNLNKSNKGIKEMVISAAWLRSLRIEELDVDAKKSIAPILWVRNDEEGGLQYIFCLPRIKEVALVVSEENHSLLNKRDDNNWKRNGWFVYTISEYKKLQNKNFNFVILDKTLSEKNEDVRRCSSNRFFIEAESTNLAQREIRFSMKDSIVFREEKDFQNALLNLYKEYANEDSEFMIAVSDAAPLEGLDTCHVVDIQSLSSKEDSLNKYEYIYRKHNDTKKEFDDFVDKYTKLRDWGELEFIEGITGGNSTDRLVRHTKINNLWAYKHLHAMKTRVAIFDERLFSNTTGVELSQLQSAHIEWEEVLKDKAEVDAREFVKDYDNKQDKLLAKNRELRTAFNDYSKKQILEFVKEHYSDRNVFQITEVSSVVYHKKKTDLFTLTKTFDGVIIWGVNFDDFGDSKYGRVEAVGKIVIQEKDGEVLTTVVRYGNKAHYDYISLHQGLLDKVYEVFPIKLDNRPELKMAVTKAIYNSFVNPDEKNDDFLQGMIIHSGRSKPNEKDMPQHQPFLQYSAIENSFTDCKYSLVEVLDYACFEKNNEE